ncbi:hypothetical protein [Enterococcus faecium]
MDGMDFDELMRWRELAIERFKAMNQVKNQGYYIALFLWWRMA